MGSDSAPRHFRIFLSSPGDVSEEREKARSFITNELAKRVPHQDDVTCEVIAWDNPFSRIPLLGNEAPQESVNKFGRKPSACDVVVVMLWSRIGTPFMLEGARYESGTEWEYLDARSAVHNPPILLYKRTEKPPTDVDLSDPELMEKVAQKRDQYQKVGAFFEKRKEDGVGVNAYENAADFDTLLRQHLPDVIANLMKEAKEEVVAVDDVGAVVDPSGPPEGSRERYLKALRSDCLQIPLNVLGEEAKSLRAVTLDQVFISLQVTQKNLAHLKDEDHWMRQDEGERVQAIEAISSCKELVLLGDPGSGKSSLVKHVLANVAECELNQTGEYIPEAGELLPVFIVLRDLAPKLTKATLPVGADKRRKKLAGLMVDQAIAYAESLQTPEFASGIRQAFTSEKVFLVLDGMDEVPSYQRDLVREAVQATLSQFNLSRVIVTCRIRSYTGASIFEGVQTYTLAKLDEALISIFVDKWYEAQTKLGRVKEHDREERSRNLKEVATKDPLFSLAQNPMLLTTMTIIHQQDTVLPKQRVKLYEKAVDLLLRRWQEDKRAVSEELAEFIDSPEKKMRLVVERLAFEAHKSRAGDEADLEREKAIKLLSKAQYLGHESLASQFLDYVDLRSGLLIGRGGTKKRPNVYSFPHRQFQEYLAGCYVVGAPPRVLARLRELAAEGEFWSEAVQLGIEEQVFNSGSYGKYNVMNLASQASKDVSASGEEAEQRLILWMGKVPEVIGASEVAEDPGDVEPGEQLLERLQGQLVNVLGGTLPPIERVEAGRTLGKIGDPRKELLTLEDMVFCYVPEGPFEMGGNDYDWEKPEATIDVPYGYWIGKSPVTQAQFQKFTEAGGYENDEWWTPAGWEYMQQQERKAPEIYSYPSGLPNNPVVGITWYEAHAFCTWLTAHAREEKWIKPGFKLVLPNEPEWEKAARGGLEIPGKPIYGTLLKLEVPVSIVRDKNPSPKRAYPWEGAINENHCNYNYNISSTSAPGCFPEGENHYGLHDLAGNVWEWSRSKWESSYKSGSVEQWKEWEDEKGSERRVVRGGSFGRGNFGLRCASRGGGNPSVDNFNRGFRVVALPPSE